MDAPVIVAKLPAASEALMKSAKNSPLPTIKNNKRNNSNSVTSSISCSSQVNNNYSNLDMESLDDMLRKVGIISFCI